MKHTTGIHSCEPLTMRCKGVFQLNEEITALRRGDNARVAYRSEKVVEGGLITCIPFVIVDESGEGDLLLGRFYEMEGAIVMDNFTARQLFFVDRKLLLPKRPASSLMPLDVDMVEFENRGVVLSNLRASVEPGTENFYVMCIKHRQWNITTLTWVDFRAEYIYDISKFGSDKAGILSVGNVIDVGGHGVSWSDWQGGWIIMAQSTFAHPSIALHLPSIIYIKLSFSLSIILMIMEDGDQSKTDQGLQNRSNSGEKDVAKEKVGHRISSDNSPRVENHITTMIEDRLHVGNVELQSRGLPHVNWVADRGDEGIAK
ncbi:uncharacterized protein MELLADRAFT_101144 [Melampsora larici-populina 98AG31]|uniref:Uncharacterized protein n=1 Tax=Melampsora larici-populina (strain 98AG31 / pathotype 3-4-7) TaxID=747676 RepID=F4R3S0_MELLP|nr:uncharacterized protein MELLADRAFT_101144 [Melampsora larici-populina 98AG31]EGG12676.1 hypothetical protein MELLADRAFT_101144 [Melampsora larici-populina 98AG31]